ncbi:MAG: L,D-transpeptidase family protein [Solirubrobacteraceae bacterium]
MISAAAPNPATAPITAAPEVRLALQGVHGKQRLAISGGQVHVLGTVSPYAPGQRVELRFRRDGKPDGGKTVQIVRAGASGRFRAKVPASGSGSVTVTAAHAATSAMGAFKSAPSRLRLVSPDLASGASGPAVWLLQRKLAALHYAVPLSGVYEAGTANAVVAFRKMMSLAPLESVDAGVFRRLERGQGAFHVRYPHDGKHVEANLSKQVLAEVEPDGKVRVIYTTSSGKPSTPTVLGRYRVYLKTPGINSEGMVDSNYFIRGYAIHGYAEVPTYAASHGCLRVPIEDAASIYSWVQLGTIVDVYYE